LLPGAAFCWLWQARLPFFIPYPNAVPVFYRWHAYDVASWLRCAQQAQKEGK
jgi:hypothetical protein